MANQIFPSNIIDWLRYKVLKNKDFILELINDNNYKAIEKKYESQLNLQVPEYRRLELVNYIWNEIQMLSEHSDDEKTKTQANKLLSHLRNQWLIEKCSFFGNSKQSRFHSYDFVDISKYISNDACPICYESYSKFDVIIFTPCGHTFHIVCLGHWFDKNRTCPLCRAAF